MRLIAAIVLCCVLAAGFSGCGGRTADRAPSSTTVAAPAKKPGPSPLAVGVVGPIKIDVPGTRVVHGSLARLGGLPLVLVSSDRADAATVAAAAARHPGTHYALVGGTAKDERRSNLTGVVIRDDQAARLAGLVAGYAAGDGSTPETARVAWVGPEERPLAGAFVRGLHSVAPRATFLRQWTSSVPARCKEGALAAIDRGATVVIAHDGLCAEAAVNAAHEQGLVGLELGDFELPSVAAGWIASEAEHGIYHGGDDVVFGLRSGALGVRRLDPRIPVAAATRARAAVQEVVGGLRP
jgi:hypothetical protein